MLWEGRAGGYASRRVLPGRGRVAGGMLARDFPQRGPRGRYWREGGRLHYGFGRSLLAGKQPRGAGEFYIGPDLSEVVVVEATRESLVIGQV